MSAAGAGCGAPPQAQLQDPYAVRPVLRPFDSVIEPPGSKSETTRMYALAALAEGVSVIRRPLHARDTDLLLEALRAVGAAAELDPVGGSVRIVGTAGRPAGGATVHLGDGGAPARFLLAVASHASCPVTVDGSARLRERPMAEGADLIRRLGGRVRSLSVDGHLPMEVGGHDGLRGGAVSVGRTASSQFVSAVLLAAPWTREGVEIRFTEPPTSPSYIELTVDMVRRFGVEVDVERDAFGRLSRVAVAPARPRGADLTVEPDASSAVYFLAAAAAVRDARVTIRGLPRTSRQPDTACVAALVAMGARELTVPGGVSIEGTESLRGVDLDGSRWPDGALCICAMAALARGATRIRGLETLRIKESNRVAALAQELAKFGCAVTATESSIVVDPGSVHGRPVLVDSHSDHRVAMSFAALGLARPGVSIGDPGCVAKSYPCFWQDIAALSGGA